MATEIYWPQNLRPAIRNTKTIQRAAGFRESNPAAGASYTEFFTDDQPTFMSFDLRFTTLQAAVFDAWARSNGIFAHSRTFNFPIKDEYGRNFQEVRFLSQGIPTYSDTGYLVSYSGCQIIIPDYFKPDAETVLSFYEVYGNNLEELSYLDITINQNWPEA